MLFCFVCAKPSATMWRLVFVVDFFLQFTSASWNWSFVQKFIRNSVYSREMLFQFVQSFRLSFSRSVCVKLFFLMFCFCCCLCLDCIFVFRNFPSSKKLKMFFFRPDDVFSILFSLHFLPTNYFYFVKRKSWANLIIRTRNNKVFFNFSIYAVVGTEICISIWKRKKNASLLFLFWMLFWIK